MYNDSGIYIYKNKINGKKYIGQAINLKRRYLNFQNEKNRYGGNVINNAREKYGIDAFEYSILTHCPIEELNYWEQYYIERLNTTIPNGYNMTCGGDNNYTSTSEYKEKQREKLKQYIKKKNPSLIVSQQYKSNLTKIQIICPKHGAFYRTPNSIYSTTCNPLICPDCVKEEQMALTKQNFFEKVKEKYGNYYSYDKANIQTYLSKIIVTCPKHGDFEVIAGNHISNNPNTGGCPICSQQNQHQNKMQQGEINAINRIKEKFGNNYSFENFDYKGDKNKVTLICPKHGPFSMRVHNLLRSYGCPSCRKENNFAIYHLKHSHNSAMPIKVKEKLNNEKVFIEKAQKIHGNKYDYSQVIYSSAFSKIKIICPNHGEFWQTPNNHLSGYGCPSCAVENNKHQKQVIQLSIDNQVIKKWNSIKDIEIDGAKPKSVNHIYSCCTGKKNTAFGFKWKYATDNICPKILQLLPDGQLVKIWNSIEDIHKEKPINSTQHISRCLHHKSKTAGGYIWKYEDS